MHYIPTLNGWRAIAISFVVFAHSFPSWATDSEKVSLIGTFGVRIFFALSGFLITTLLLAEERDAGRIELRSFYVRRFFRIMPAAIAVVACVAGLSIADVLKISPRRLVDTLFFFANYSSAPSAYEVAHFWSLAIEEHFYFVWPGLLVLVPLLERRLLVGIAIAFLIATWRAIAWKYQITTEDPAKFWGRTDIQVDAIVWGAVVALASVNRRIAPALTKSWVRAFVLLALPASAFAYVFVENWKWHLVSYQVFVICMPVLICQTSRGVSFVASALECGLIRWLGAISYSLYLWQQIFLTHNQDWTLRVFPLNIVSAFVCALLSYYFIERPFIRFGRDLLSRAVSKDKQLSPTKWAKPSLTGDSRPHPQKGGYP
ncbi:acyltransferase family protein [Bradyrhizobium sp. GCM10023182]|uniref:Acyltransferase n=1 Tax=Bradyrhizobium zhengyangense TaxID=2911009 RepID=A0ABS9M1S1_9BRAD|nr:acyltransferase [Bradyrhizobium zhengyangense]MCG2673210.1 acyltransferase [Bradyrhizobium zhengyangense]